MASRRPAGTWDRASNGVSGGLFAYPHRVQMNTLFVVGHTGVSRFSKNPISERVNQDKWYLPEK